MFIIREDFSDLENWEDFSFSGNKNPTKYIISTDSLSTYLKIVSQNSASGLIHLTNFDPNMYPLLTWCWRVDTIIPEVDGKKRSEDDYAIRLFVMFEDDSKETSFWIQLRNSAVKLLYGAEPPDASLCFVWANIRYEEDYFNSPYSETVKILPIQTGLNGLKKWNTYTVNIVTKFEEVFGRSCPATAKIAIMSDTDNTKSSTLAYLDYVTVGK